MAISDRIEEMYNHVGDAYDILELAGTNLSNLFNENVEQGAIGSYVGNTYENSKEDSATRIRTVNLIQLDKTKSYTISVKSGYSFAIFTFNDEKKYYDGGHAIWSSNEITITNIPYIALSFKKSSEANIVPSEIDDIQVMLNEGTIALPYVKSVDKNLINLAPTWKERLLYFINNGTDVVWNNWDKVTGEGTTLTLNNTEEAPMTIDLKGNTSQATTTGKNLLPNNGITETNNGITFTKNADNTITLNGTATANTYTNVWYNTTNNLINDTSQVYTMSIGLSNSNVGLAIFEYINNSWVNKKYLYAESTTYTPSGNQTGQIFRVIVKNGATLNNVIVKPMLVKGTTVGDYEPYTNGASPNPDYPQDIHVVSGDNEIVVNSKNQLETYNVSGTYNGVSYKFEDGVLTLNGTCTSTGGVTGLGIFRQMEGVNYAWTYVYESGSCTDYGGGLFMGATPTSITSAGYGGGFRSSQNRTVNTFTNGEKHIYYLYMALNKNSTYTNYKVKPLIVQGTTYNYDFEPYQGNTYSVNLGVENLFNQGNYVTGIMNDRTLTNNNGKLTINGTGTLPSNFEISINVTPTEDMFISIQQLGGTFSGGEIQFLFIPTSGTAVESKIGTPAKLTNGVTYTTARISVRNNVVCTNLEVGLQLEKGSKANSYTPYGTTPIELCKIGDYQDVIKKSTGKNLFDKDNANTLNCYVNGTSEIIVNLNNAKSLYIPIQSSKTYTISKILSARFVVGTCVSTPANGVACSVVRQNSTGTSITITSGASDKFLCVFYYLSGTDTLTEQQILNSIMINEGSTALPYEPYGTGWYVKKEIGKIVLNGTSNAFTSKSGTANVLLTTGTITNIKRPPNNNSLSTIYCNIGKSTYTPNQLYSNSYIGTTIRVDGTIAIGFGLNNSQNITDVTSGNSWLTTNNVSLYFPLDTPTYTGITGELISQLNALAKSYNSQTNISQESNDLPFIINATALGEME